MVWLQLPPIYGGGMRLGSFIIWRNDHDFVDEDLILVEIASTVVGLQLLNLQTENLEETIRKQTAINMAINTLSYSEIKQFQLSWMSWTVWKAAWQRLLSLTVLESHVQYR